MIIIVIGVYSLVVVVASLVRVLWCVVVALMMSGWVLIAKSVVGALVVHVFLIVVRDHGVILVVDGSSVSLVLKLDVRLLLVVLLVVRVEVCGHIVVDGMVVHNAWLIVVLVVSHALNEVMG